ncbi:diadenylate cyclase [Aporhodopirellula aestuarii]|uniref:Diadenylate cyclase n=1 Tax=Aporhodopirellula aestuarii TaxID=2950107 RepID=A0ABT0U2P9_9BACT|nr:diadenylate cyclase [Aporhodopirellula aestuarii]MCM2370871.1 diadenylate cyclase [Aporhodopirellula aestuarii]
MPFDLQIPSVSFVDLLDIGIFAMAVYVLLAIGIQRGSRRGLAVIGIFVAIYVLAMRWQMPLSLTVFRVGFSAMIVSIAIVYQDDVRAAAERIGRWMLGGRSLVVSNASKIADTLVHAAFHMAEKRTGALIVIQGRDALDRLLDGGIDLDAVASAPLFYSLFDPNSAGHDGAVVMRNGRVAKFATHLPLAKCGRADDFGTRHHAALGLADCCDAFVIVVSEERGCVSVAHGGRLDKMEGPGALATRLQSFNAYRRLNERKVTLSELFRKRVVIKLAALLIATGCWWMISSGANEVYRTFVVPVEYRNVAEHVKLSQTLTQEVKVTLAGSETAFRFLAPSSIVVSLDLEDVAAGKRQFNVTPDTVRHPNNLRVTAIEPRSVRVKVEPH